MLISVIIPVYNAENFVTSAVESALNQPETGEIILIEDGSPDKCLLVCRELEKKYPKVKLIQHENGKNKGAAESRNLGILHSKYEYIAFLDADDIYLPNRFCIAKKKFSLDPSVDAVLEAVVLNFLKTIAQLVTLVTVI